MKALFILVVEEFSAATSVLSVPLFAQNTFTMKVIDEPLAKVQDLFFSLILYKWFVHTCFYSSLCADQENLPIMVIKIHKIY